jgi:hypothetical protein
VKRVLLTLTFIGFTAGGVAILIFGTAEDRPMGAMCVLFFGAGGSAYVGLPLLTRRTGEVLAELGRADGEPAFLFPQPRSKLALILVGLTGMTAASVLLLVAGALFPGIVGTVIFGGVLLLTLVSALTGHRTQLALTPTRVIASGAFSAVELPWDAVGEVTTYDQPTARGASVPMLGIDALDPAAVRRTGWMRGLRGLDKRLTPFDLTIGAQVFTGSGESVAAAVCFYRDRPQRRARIGTPEELAGGLRTA